MADPEDLAVRHGQYDKMLMRDMEIEDVIKNGRILMANGQYPEALSQIMRAVNLCPCEPAGNGKARHGKDKSCHISQCIAAVQGDPDTLYRVAQSPCACGYSWPSCTQHLHALALDTLAACLQRAEQYVSAFSTALSVIRLDPASPLGYSRVTKVLAHLASRSQESDPAVDRSLSTFRSYANLEPSAPLQDLIKCFLKAGVDYTERYRREPNNSYHFVLYKMAQNRKTGPRRDPVRKLPAELLSMIFSYLDFTALSHCLLVNKQWNQVVLQDKKLWRDVRLKQPRRPGRWALRDFLHRHQEIRSLVIRDTSKFGLTTSRLNQIFYGLPQLERLCLSTGREHGSADQDAVSFGIPDRAGANLTQLSLVAFFCGDTVRNFLRLTCDTLEVLDLVRTGGDVSGVVGSVQLPRLKKLRLMACGMRPNLFGRGLIEIAPIVMATPSLEHFHLDGFEVCWLMPDNQLPAPPLSKSDLWRRLRHLVMGSSMSLGPASTLTRVLPPLPRTLRRIEILNDSPIAPNVLSTADPPAGQIHPDIANAVPEHPYLPDLEMFRCHSPVEADILRHVLEPAVKAGSLKMLELAIEGSPQPDWLPPNDGTLPMPARDYAFAACESVHTVGLQSFNWDPSGTYPYPLASTFHGDPFLDWLDCFPNLHTVYFYPGNHWPDIDLFILRRLLPHPRIRVLYQDALKGCSWDEAVRLAAEHGKRLLHRPHWAPIGWAILEDEPAGDFALCGDV
ncbi:hypothetical protein VTK56DRAFT_1389 [Thermocarpiscus australiensis]